jgi:hypothetical protein
MWAIRQTNGSSRARVMVLPKSVVANVVKRDLFVDPFVIIDPPSEPPNA